MPRKDFTITSKIIMALFAASDASSYFIGTPYSILRTWEGRRGDSRWILYELSKRGVIKIIDKDNERFIKLTKKGQLEALFEKAKLPEKPKYWDGKWRLVIFDIPEDSHKERDQLRAILRKFGFIKLQISCYICPHPLNRDAILFLRKSGLIRYIRIAKIEELDDDRDLRRRFHLKRP